MSQEKTKYLIWSFEKAMWWKSNKMGYTPNVKEAGRYNEYEAREICRNANICGTINEELVRETDYSEIERISKIKAPFNKKSLEDVIEPFKNNYFDKDPSISIIDTLEKEHYNVIYTVFIPSEETPDIEYNIILENERNLQINVFVSLMDSGHYLCIACKEVRPPKKNKRF